MSNGEGLESEAAQSSHRTLWSLTEPEYAVSTGATQATSIPSTSRGIGGQGTSEQALFAPEDGRIRVLKQLEESTDSFRGRQGTKTDANSSILRILNEDAAVLLTPTQKEATFNSYLTEIMSIESSREESGDPRDSGEQPIDSSPSRENLLLHDTGRVRQCALSEEGDEDEGNFKRQKLNESDMPWYTDPTTSPSSFCDPSCEETRQLLRAYNRDISKAKFFDCPQLPNRDPIISMGAESQRDSVDLNQIFASLHHIIP